MIEFMAFSDMCCSYSDSENTHISVSDAQKLSSLRSVSSDCRFVASLGNIVDGKSDAEKSKVLLDEILSLCRETSTVHPLLGEKDSVIDKNEFFLTAGYSIRYRAFDVSSYHCIFLDTLAKKDGKVSFVVDAEQLGWVSRLLGKSHRPAIIFSHAPIAVSDPSLNGNLVSNSAEVRNIFEKSNKVALVVQGHSKKQDRLLSNGVPYITLAPMNKSNEATFAKISVSSAGVKVTGFGDQESFSFSNIFTRNNISFRERIMGFIFKDV